jgi:hypothetical protein
MCRLGCSRKKKRPRGKRPGGRCKVEVEIPLVTEAVSCRTGCPPQEPVLLEQVPPGQELASLAHRTDCQHLGLVPQELGPPVPVSQALEWLEPDHQTDSVRQPVPERPVLSGLPAWLGLEPPEQDRQTDCPLPERQGWPVPGLRVLHQTDRSPLGPLGWPAPLA